jgi:hypothetical protein
VALTEGVPTARIENPAFSSHADMFRFGSHVCPACAYLYSYPKRTHRNVLAIGDRTYWPMLGWDSATAERPTWWDLLHTLAEMPAETPVAGVMTTDPHPRLWPRTRLATVGRFGLYVHDPRYNVSSFIAAPLAEIVVSARLIQHALHQGWNKRACTISLWHDYARARRHLPFVVQHEPLLAAARQQPSFVIARLVAGIPTQEATHGSEPQSDSGPARQPHASRAARREAHQDQLGLFQ